VGRPRGAGGDRLHRLPHLRGRGRILRLPGERFDGHDFVAAALQRGVAGVVVSRPVANPGRGFAVLAGETLTAFGRLAAAHRSACRAEVVGVTGSNGKTTTKEMVAHVLAADRPGTRSQKSFNNLVGVPVTLLSIRPEHRFAVVEIGTNAPGEVAHLSALARPDLAVVTSVAPSHLEGLGTVERVCEEETDVITGLADEGLIAANADSPGLAEAVRRKRRGGQAVVTYGRSGSADIRLTDLVCRWDGCEFAVGGTRFRLPVPGPHNAVNALAAVAVGRAMGLSDRTVAERLETVRLPDMRLQAERLTRGEGPALTLINDAYNANPGSMAAALEVLKLAPSGTRRVFCAGAMLELGPGGPGFHRQLGREAARWVDVLVAVGPMAEDTAAGAKAASPGLPVKTFADSDSAAAEIAALVRPGDFVLVKGSRGVRMEKLAEAVRRVAG
jgi:UDP-N-acetylmuramoyl-tripeptide--D-alanyl-D-alanine ligase